jgi:phosphoglycolate phosphatase
VADNAAMSPLPLKFPLLVFDWDGTLFDSTALIVKAIQAAVADLGYTPPSNEAASHVIGLGLTQALAHAAPEVPKEQWPQLGERYRHHYSAHLNDIDFFPGTIAMLRELKAKGHTLAVATGKSRRGLDDALLRGDVASLFDATRTADETRGKPDPLMLNELMEELGHGPPHTLMVGDTSHDLNLAINAGCPAVAVSFGAHPVDGLQACKPLHIAHSTVELHQWLLQNA